MYQPSIHALYMQYLNSQNQVEVVHYHEFFQIRRLRISDRQLVSGRGEIQFMLLAALSATQYLSHTLTLGSQ